MRTSMGNHPNVRNNVTVETSRLSFTFRITLAICTWFSARYHARNCTRRPVIKDKTGRIDQVGKCEKPNNR